MKKIDFKISAFCVICLFVIKINAQVVSTYAGNGVPGSTDGSALFATFEDPHGIYINSAGDIYIADQNSHKIRKITSAGVVSTFAGSGVAGSTNGTGTSASFNRPRGICADASGNLYIADSFNHKIRKITSAGAVTNFAGSGIAGSTDATGAAASFNGPRGICADASGNIYVTDEGNHKIRKITPAGVVTTFAGTGISGAVDGPVATASFNVPQGICIDGSGNFYVADRNNNSIRKISSTGVVSTLAGSGTAGFVDGTGVAASFNKPVSVYANSTGDIFVSDQNSHAIRKITPTGVVTTIAGSGVVGSTNGTGTAASFNFPAGLCLNSSGDIFVADLGNHKIRKIVVCVAPLAPTNTTPSSNQTLCENNSTILSATSTGTVNWFSTPTSTTVLASGTSYTTSVLSAGTYTYYAEASTCSVSATRAAITVTVNATPIVSVNSGSICSGSSFTINPSGANTYTISGGSTIVTPTTNTSYNVTGTSAQGCVSSNTAMSSVTVNTLPNVTAITNNTLLCTGQTATLTASGASTYLWNTSATTSVIAASPTVQTTYTVTGTDANGCVNSSTVTQNVSLCTGINSQIANQNSQIVLYPNPSNGIFTISGIEQNTSISIYNAIGELVKSIQSTDNNTTIDLPDYSNGIYFIKVKNNNADVIQKIIKQ